MLNVEVIVLKHDDVTVSRVTKYLISVKIMILFYRFTVKSNTELF